MNSISPINDLFEDAYVAEWDIIHCSLIDNNIKDMC